MEMLLDVQFFSLLIFWYVDYGSIIKFKKEKKKKSHLTDGWDFMCSHLQGIDYVAL